MKFEELKRTPITFWTVAMLATPPALETAPTFEEARGKQDRVTQAARRHARRCGTLPRWL
jgi:hypothetical protein